MESKTVYDNISASRTPASPYGNISPQHSSGSLGPSMPSYNSQTHLLANMPAFAPTKYEVVYSELSFEKEIGEGGEILPLFCC
jgi:hypothetical protein